MQVKLLAQFLTQDISDFQPTPQNLDLSKATGQILDPIPASGVIELLCNSPSLHTFYILSYYLLDSKHRPYLIPVLV